MGCWPGEVPHTCRCQQRRAHGKAWCTTSRMCDSPVNNVECLLNWFGKLVLSFLKFCFHSCTIRYNTVFWLVGFNSIYFFVLFLAAVGPCCCPGAFHSCGFLLQSAGSGVHTLQKLQLPD